MIIAITSNNLPSSYKETSKLLLGATLPTSMKTTQQSQYVQQFSYASTIPTVPCTNYFCTKWINVTWHSYITDPSVNNINCNTFDIIMEYYSPTIVVVIGRPVNSLPSIASSCLRYKRYMSVHITPKPVIHHCQ